jgi:hypothetical protein
MPSFGSTALTIPHGRALVGVVAPSGVAPPSNALLEALSIAPPGTPLPDILGSLAFASARGIGAPGILFAIRLPTAMDIVDLLLEDMAKVGAGGKEPKTVEELEAALKEAQERLDWMHLLSHFKNEDTFKKTVAAVLKSVADAKGGTAGLKVVTDLNHDLVTCNLTVSEWVDSIEPDPHRVAHKQWQELKAALQG